MCVTGDGNRNMKMIFDPATINIIGSKGCSQSKDLIPKSEKKKYEQLPSQPEVCGAIPHMPPQQYHEVIFGSKSIQKVSPRTHSKPLKSATNLFELKV